MSQFLESYDNLYIFLTNTQFRVQCAGMVEKPNEIIDYLKQPQVIAGVVILGTFALTIGRRLAGGIIEGVQKERLAKKLAPGLFSSRKNVEMAGLNPDNLKDLTADTVIGSYVMLRNQENFKNQKGIKASPDGSFEYIK